MRKLIIAFGVILIIIVNLTIPIFASDTLYESWTTNLDATSVVEGTYWLAQTFTPSTTHYITSVKLYGWNSNQTNPNFTVSIKATNSNVPTGGALCSSTFALSIFDEGTMESPVWREITFSTGATLNSGTMYAIVVSCPAQNPVLDSLYFNTTYYNYYYAGGGTCHSTDSGSTWVSDGVAEGYDLGFYEYGVTIPDAPTNVAAGDGAATDKVVVTWTKSTGATGYRVYRDGTDVSGLLGDVATYNDTGATAGSISYTSVSASDGTYEAYVALSVSGVSTSNGATHTYKVVAVNAAGTSADSSTDTGYRGIGTVAYQWERSATDSDSGSFSNITGGTTNPYNDNATLAYGTGRYFLCVLSASGAASTIITTSDRGYRIGAPAILAKSATNVSFISAKLNSEVTGQGGDSEVSVRFGYGSDCQTAVNFESYAVKTDWVAGYHTGDLPTITVTGLNGSTVYYYRAQIKNTSTTVTSTTEITFDTTKQFASLTDYTISSGASSILSGNPLMPPQMYTELDTSKIPFGPVVDDILEQSDTPPALWWFPFIFLLIGIFGLLIYGLTAKNGNEGSLLLLSIVIEAGLILFGIMGTTNTSSIIPLFPAFLFVIPAFAIIISKKQYGW